MKPLILLLPLSLILSACNEGTTGAAPTETTVQSASARARYLTALVLPVVPPNAPNPQFVVTDIARVDYTCVAGIPQLSVVHAPYPGRTLKLCVDLESLDSIPDLIADNIQSLCSSAAPVLAAAGADPAPIPSNQDPIFGIRAFNEQGKPAQVHLTGAPCPREDVLN